MNPLPDSDGEKNFPAAKGENELGGKTYFVYSDKTEFAADGTYKTYAAKWNENGSYELTGDGKYTYAEIENGTYSWDDTSKKVVLKPAKIAVQEGPNIYGLVQDASGYREEFQKMLDDYAKENGQDVLNQQLASYGFLNVSAFIDYGVKEMFATKTFAYVFAAEGAALLLSKALPSSEGSNELNGKTFYGLVWQNKEQEEYGFVKVEDQTYVFTGTGYTYTAPDNTQIGTYAWNAQRKWVHLKPDTINGETNVEYFASLTDSYVGPYNSATDYHAARTNEMFVIREYPYNLTEETVGYDR